MNRLMNWLKLALGLREPTPHESAAQLRHAASVMMVYSPSTGQRLLKQAEEAERQLAGRG